MAPTATLRLQQEVADTYRLARVGGWFYLAAWLIVAWYGGAFVHSPRIAWPMTAALLALALGRVLHKAPSGELDTCDCARWLRMHWAIVICTTSLFGTVFVWTMLDPRMAPPHEALLLAVMGLSVAVAHAFNMRLAFAIVGVVSMYVPGLLALWMSTEHRGSAWMMTLYFTYVCVALVRSHGDYQHHLDVDEQLREQRDQFETQGRTDALTGLANRRHFTELLMDLSEASRNSGSSLVLMVLDLDHFKSINDRHGHAVGDTCLAIFSARLRAMFGGKGVFPARLGGEEFGVLMQGKSLEQALQHAEQLRALCEREPVLAGNTSVSLTVSIGVASFNALEHGDGDGLYRDADAAVYRAKHSGRNQVCAA